MPYLIALALVIATALVLCARLFPRTHTHPARPSTHADLRSDDPRPARNERRAPEGDAP